jgi:CheY-like chemotaxis protein
MTLIKKLLIMAKTKRIEEAKMEVQYILIVENGHIDRTYVSDSLQRDGFNVRYANSTELALSMLVKERPFLIVIDVNVPKLEAMIFARILKNDEDTNQIKLIAFSDTEINIPIKPFDNRVITDGKDSLLIKGVRMYVVTMRMIISTIVFKNAAYETNY